MTLGDFSVKLFSLSAVSVTVARQFERFAVSKFERLLPTCHKMKLSVIYSQFVFVTTVATGVCSFDCRWVRLM